MSAFIHIHVILYVSMYMCLIVCVHVCCIFGSMFVCACLYAHVSMHVCVPHVNMCVCRGVVMGSERGLLSDRRLLFTPTPACGTLLDCPVNTLIPAPAASSIMEVGGSGICFFSN